MKGKILHFEESDNTGKIIGNDGIRYSFVKMDFKSKEMPVQGMEVDFEVVDSGAKDIFCTQKSTYSQNDGKKWLVTLLLAIFVGSLGIHRFYTGHTAIGVIQLLTLGGCGIWALIDVIMIITGSFKDIDGKDLVKD